jgi:uncharacterized protein (DUF1697 family)
MIGAMERLIVLLRAVNVGKRQMAMADLRALAGEMGYGEPKTYVASGNLIVTAERAAVERDLPGALAERFGFAVEIIVRGVADLERALSFDPFAEAAKDEPNRVWLLMSQREIAADTADRLMERAQQGESIAQRDQDLWMHMQGHVGSSKVTPSFIDRMCGSPTTGRNVRTVLTLIGLAQ